MEEITAEFNVAPLGEPVSLQTRVRATVAAKTDLGRVRENNEDKFEFYVPEDDNVLATRGAVYLVCDGMGGHAAGQIASEIACKTFIDVYLHHPSQDPTVAMLSAVQAANRFVVDVGMSVPSRKGMGCTLSGLILLQDAAYTVQVGDSRIYRLRQGELAPLTWDHTYADELYRAGMISYEDSLVHPKRHMLTRAIGGAMDVQPDIERHELRVGDAFLLCSDGLTNHVSDGEIAAAMSANGPAEAVWKLVGAALLGGGSDNTTALVVRIDSLEAA